MSRAMARSWLTAMSRRVKRHEQQLLAPEVQRPALSRREREALRRKSNTYRSRHRADCDLIAAALGHK